MAGITICLLLLLAGKHALAPMMTTYAIQTDEIEPVPPVRQPRPGEYSIGRSE